NERGELLSRFHNTEITPESARTIPIVKNLLGSGSDNGSQEYSYEDKEYLGSYQIISFGRIGIVSTVPADRAFEAVYLIQAQNLKIMLIVLVLAFLFVYFFARTLSAPIRRLLRATGRIEDGDYEVDIAPTTHDEIGTLTNSFISMAHGLAERQKIKDTFGKFVNPAIVNRALNSDLRLGGEERICTILFSDLRNFTGMSEKLKPEEVVSILTEYFTRMVDCVHDEGGVVDKFIGDAVMAHWGALVANPGDPSSAVRAALRMRTALLELNSDSFRKRGLNLRFGIGINTGTVLAGQIGSERRLEYTVIGDAVNLTSRIEYLNKHFGTDILISHYTYEKLDPLFHTVELPPIQIKGKSNPETVYAVLGLRNNPATPASLNELRELLSIEYNPDIARKYIEASSDIILDEKALFQK
ncbi:MAG: adenylate/guanylate cyclase domain-containing protein, partial [Leptospiraceae bacterium]|nr:adenylate/guanylate cyclase domain-containing protein [Leptospiraceae bacterium]